MPEESETIVPRNIRFPIGESPKHDWFNGDTLLTTFCDALSVFFPVGERFFIDSVKYYADRIDDPRLAKDIKLFCAQEAYHTREHEAYNKHLGETYGYDIKSMEDKAAHALSLAKNPMGRLVVTVTIEHITSTLSHLILTDPKMLENATPAYRDLWTWHAIEEWEHKSVAYDVYLAVTKNVAPWKRYLARTGALTGVTIALHRIAFSNFLYMMRHRGESAGIKMWLRVIRLMWIFPGYYRRVLRYFLRFYSPFFHPASKNDLVLLERERERFFNLTNARESKHVN